MELPDIKEIAPSESGYPIRNYALKPYDDDAEFREQFNVSDSYFKYLFKKGFVSIWTKHKRYFCRDGIICHVDR